MFTEEFLQLFKDAILFGIVDNGVMLAGAFFGLGLEKYLPKRFQVGLGAIIGAGLGNTVSDFMGGAVSLNWALAFGTALGCLIAMTMIPIIHKLKNK